MTRKRLASREFERDPGAAKRAADEGSVFVVTDGEVSHVLLSVTDYRRLGGKTPSLVDLLGMDEDVEFDPPRVGAVTRPVDLD